MKTLWLTNDLPPRAGGIEQFLGNLLTRSSADAIVIGPPNPSAAEHDRDAPYDVIRHDRTVLPTPRVMQVVRDVGRRHRPDVVVLGAAWPLGELAPRIRRELGVPVVALSHGHEAGLCSVGAGYLVRRATRGLALLTTISDYTESKLQAHVRASRIERLPPGVDVEAFRPDLDGRDMRERWGVPDDATLVGCISRLVPRKGQDQLLRVWPEVARARPGAWLVIVGEGPLQSELREQADGLDRAVVVGPVPWTDLPASYAALDLFAMPCRTRNLGLDVEGLGIVYLEAQASGVPVIAGMSGGAPETVDEPASGVVVDGRDATALRDSLIRLLGDGDLRRSMGETGRRWAVERWSWDVIADRMSALLSSTVTSSP